MCNLLWQQISKAVFRQHTSFQVEAQSAAPMITYNTVQKSWATCIYLYFASLKVNIWCDFLFSSAQPELN